MKQLTDTEKQQLDAKIKEEQERQNISGKRTPTYLKPLKPDRQRLSLYQAHFGSTVFS